MKKIQCIKMALKALDTEERNRLFPCMSEAEFEKLLVMNDETFLKQLYSFLDDSNNPENTVIIEETRWFDKKLSGLTREGIKILKDLEKQGNFGASQLVDQKKVRYLKTLKNMLLEVPDSYRSLLDIKTVYRSLVAFSRENDIPEEITASLIPAIMTYRETGRMRPVLFIGEKGCGKTTAVRLLMKEALQLPVEVIKAPQSDTSHGMTGDSATFQGAEAGMIVKAQIRNHSLIVALLIDEIDKVSHPINRKSLDDELLSITDESCSEIIDNYLELPIIGLEHCPIFFTANEMPNPILADRCTVLHFPEPSIERIRSISHKYVINLQKNRIYNMIDFDNGLLDQFIEDMYRKNVTSIRKYQQLIEETMKCALNFALTQTSDDIVKVTSDMFYGAEQIVLGADKRHIGF